MINLDSLPGPSAGHIKDKNEENMADKQHDVATNLPITVPMHVVNASTSQSLKHGMLQENKSGGPGGRYVLVPTGWRRASEDYVSTIFAALNIAVPPLIFETDKCPKLFPDIGLVRKFEDGTDTFSSFEVKVEGVTEQEMELFSIVMKERMVSIIREITAACIQCNAIYAMFHPSYINVFDKIITDGSAGGITLGIPPHELLPEGMLHAIVENAVPLTEEIVNAVQWSNGPIKTGDHENCRDIDDGECIPHLNVNLSHMLIFEDERDRSYFTEIISREIPLGLLCAGGTLKLFRKSVQAISSGTPLFVFKHTLRTGHCFSSLLEYYNDTMNSTIPIGQVKPIEDRLFPSGNNTYLLFRDMREKSLGLAYNWPADFNTEAILHIDPLVEHPKKLLMGIINVMSSMHGSSFELGGGSAEFEAIQQAYKMAIHFKVMAERQLQIATMLKVAGITLSLFITICACTSLHMRLYHSNVLDEKPASGIVLKAGNIALPILLGICITLFTAFSPLDKWAMLTMARAQVESEAFRYVCRVGDYKATRGGAEHRVNFAKKMQNIWDSVAATDVVGDINDTTGGITDQTVATFFKPHQIKEQISRSGRRMKVVPEGQQGNKEVDLENGKDNSKEEVRQEVLNDSGGLHTDVLESTSSFQLMSGEGYINARLRTQLDRLEKETPSTNCRLGVLQVIVIIVSSVGAIFAMYDQEIWIPALLACAHFIDSALNFWQLKLKSQRAGYSYSQLKKALLWWNGLTIIQQRVPSYKKQLVDTVENIILTEVEMLTQAQIKRTEDDDSAVESNGGAALANKFKKELSGNQQ